MTRADRLRIARRVRQGAARQLAELQREREAASGGAAMKHPRSSPRHWLAWHYAIEADVRGDPKPLCARLLDEDILLTMYERRHIATYGFVPSGGRKRGPKVSQMAAVSLLDEDIFLTMYERRHIATYGFVPSGGRKRGPKLTRMAANEKSREIARKVILASQGGKRGLIGSAMEQVADELELSVDRVKQHCRHIRKLRNGKDWWGKDWWEYNCRMVRKGKFKKMY
jgi:hypothetical protein